MNQHDGDSMSEFARRSTTRDRQYQQAFAATVVIGIVLNFVGLMGGNGRSFIESAHIDIIANLGETTGRQRPSLCPHPGPVVPPLPWDGLIRYNFAHVPI